jgi:hypothetical protein
MELIIAAALHEREGTPEKEQWAYWEPLPDLGEEIVDPILLF